jgi:single-strand DNA-binding protein
MINKVFLIGHLGGDPEVRRLDTGATVARFSLATGENYKDKEGNLQKKTEWHNVVVWRELADRAEKFLKKGMLLYVEGKVSYRKYTDKDGMDRYVTDIVGNTFRMLEKQSGDMRLPSYDPKEVGHGQVPMQDSIPVGDGDDGLPF